MIHMYYVTYEATFPTSRVADIFMRTKHAARPLHKDSPRELPVFWRGYAEDIHFTTVSEDPRLMPA
jgi:hypothetical protein